MPSMDWQGVLTGLPLQWILSGFLTTLWVSAAGIFLATLLAILLLALARSCHRALPAAGGCRHHRRRLRRPVHGHPVAEKRQ